MATPVGAPIILARGLSKHFQVAHHREGGLGALRGLVDRRRLTVKAVDDLSFSIGPGELVGYLGPNGAGKSTTIKMLTGILVPTSGELAVAGYLPWRDRQAYVRHIGAVFGQRSSLWWDLPVIESFQILRAIYRIDPERYRSNLRRFDEVLGLGAFLHTPVRQLSLGQRMRADLAAALLHEPRLLFLDEPTIGLDVAARERIRAFIREMNREQGVTVLLTTHDMGDVEKLCDRVLLIAEGRLLFDGGLPALRRRYGGERELVVDFAEDALDGWPAAEGAAPALEPAWVAAREGLRVTYRFRASDTTAGALIAALVGAHRIQDLVVREPEIEGVVRRFYEEERGVEAGEI